MRFAQFGTPGGTSTASMNALLQAPAGADADDLDDVDTAFGLDVDVRGLLIGDDAVRLAGDRGELLVRVRESVELEFDVLRERRGATLPDHFELCNTVGNASSNARGKRYGAPPRARQERAQVAGISPSWRSSSA